MLDLHFHEPKQDKCCQPFLRHSCTYFFEGTFLSFDILEFLSSWTWIYSCRKTYLSYHCYFIECFVKPCHPCITLAYGSTLFWQTACMNMQINDEAILNGTYLTLLKICNKGIFCCLCYTFVGYSLSTCRSTGKNTNGITYYTACELCST